MLRNKKHLFRSGSVQLQPEKTMTKVELVNTITKKQEQFSDREVGVAVNSILDQICDTLNEGGRVEVRGFGSFSVRFWGPRHARNPTTGETWRTPPVHAVHFKPGKDLRDRVNANYALSEA